MQQGRHRQALAIAERVRDQRIALLGDGDPAVAVDWNNLGAALLALDRSRPLPSPRRASATGSTSPSKPMPCWRGRSGSWPDSSTRTRGTPSGAGD